MNKSLLFYRYVEGDLLNEMLLIERSKETYENLEKIHRFRGNKWGNYLLSSNSMEEYLYNFSEYIRSFLYKTPLGKRVDEKFRLTKEFLESMEIINLRKNPVLVHGDVKPGNIIISPDYQLYFIDWGRSRFFLKEYDLIVPDIHGYRNFASSLQRYFKNLNFENLIVSATYHLLDLAACIIYDSQVLPSRIISKYKRTFHYLEKNKNINGYCDE